MSRKLSVVLGLVIAFGLFFEIAAHADEFNEQTTVTFNTSVQIPGQVLPAGSYTFERADPNDNQNIVRIFNADRSVDTMVQTVSADRMEPTGDTSITVAEQESGKPVVLLKWFYPGSLDGHEFVYPRQQETHLAQEKQDTFVGGQLMTSAPEAGVTAGD